MRSVFMTAAAVSLGLASAGAAKAAIIIPEGTPGTTGVTALYMNQLSEISTSDATATQAQLQTFLGAPDDAFSGIGEQSVTYDLGSYRIFDGIGQDLNVYEVDFGSVEFGEVDILVSTDGVTFFSIDSTQAAEIDLAGDELHGNGAFARSFDLGGAVAALNSNEFRYVRVQGTNSGNIGGGNDFDLEAVGFANFRNTAMGGVPEPATWALMIMGFGLIGGTMRTRREGRDKALKLA